MNGELDQAAVAALHLMQKGPFDFEKASDFAKETGQSNCSVTKVEIISRLAALKEEAGHELVHKWRIRIAEWDGDNGQEWIGKSQPRTTERRNLCYQRLGFTDTQAVELERYFPVPDTDDGGSKISGKFVRWYPSDFSKSHGLYWDQYSNYLLEQRRMDPNVVEMLRESTFEVVSRLADPTRNDVYAARGLVVGYVQSGKTTNFTGVIARAIDAGYRLIIVLAGSHDILRNQTQRRLDMELVGVENIESFAGNEHEYQQDPDWLNERFIRYGQLPSQLGAANIIRLTGSNDFKELGNGISALELEKVAKSQPVNSPGNLGSSSARIAVVKKNAIRLDSLVSDLEKLGKHRLKDIPALIIDDESDQASINTIDPNKPKSNEDKKRTAINALIVKILKLLPRAQYIGYTATPFANVFIDPSSEEDLFPRNFLITLPRSPEYMGASDFHDSEDSENSDDPALSNKAAFVREITSPIDDDDNDLQSALDSFLLTGAIKLYRAASGELGDFKHHTMLVHQTHLQQDHRDLADRIIELWDHAGYRAGGGESRLKALLAKFAVVSSARQPNLPFPRDYADLRKYVGEALERIENSGGPCIIVNGTEDATTPDFDTESVWKVVVGGAKLSRGYTIEGLTITYFRRRTNAKDTMMQMGRWFGYRPGYGDLVRLFIGTHELIPRKQSKNSKAKTTPKYINLYEAFAGACQCEEDFRALLKAYSLPDDGSEPIEPVMVPPVVANYFPELLPTAPNKMRNAELSWENLGGKTVARTVTTDDPDLLRENLDTLQKLLDKSTADSRQGLELGTVSSRFKADVFIAPHAEFVTFLEEYNWSTSAAVNGSFSSVISFFRGDKGDPGITDWALILPKRSSGVTSDPREHSSNLKKIMRVQLSGMELDPIERTRSESGRFGVFAGRNHREIARQIVAGPFTNDATEDSRKLAATGHEGRGVILLWAVFAKPYESHRDEIPTVGFELQVPRNGLQKAPVWKIRNQAGGGFV